MWSGKEYRAIRASCMSAFSASEMAPLTALHDRSDGFFRRQIEITTKDKPEDRIDDPHLVEKMVAEKERILLWCLEGLKRLVANDYRFTISQRTKDNIAAIIKDANNILSFFASEGYITFHEDSKAATNDLYAAYKEWCDDNAEDSCLDVKERHIKGLNKA